MSIARINIFMICVQIKYAVLRKNIFSEFYIQHEIGLIYHHSIIIVNNGGSGVHTTDKHATEAEEKTQYAAS